MMMCKNIQELVRMVFVEDGRRYIPLLEAETGLVSSCNLLVVEDFVFLTDSKPVLVVEDFVFLTDSILVMVVVVDFVFLTDSILVMAVAGFVWRMRNIQRAVGEKSQDTAVVDLEGAEVEMSTRKAEGEMIQDTVVVDLGQAEVETSTRKVEVEEMSVHKAEVEVD